MQVGEGGGWKLAHTPLPHCHLKGQMSVDFSPTGHWLLELLVPMERVAVDE